MARQAGEEEEAADAYALRPWTDIVRLYPDVESGQTAVAIQSIDLGALIHRP